MCQELCESVERHDAIALATKPHSACMVLQDAQRPRITNGHSVYCCAVLGPKWKEQLLEHIPESNNVDIFPPPPRS